jgi:coenzyme F420-reducing hydrogenase beta subunit
MEKSFLETNDKQYCCGCESCAQVCGKKSITMTADEEGFLYPKIDKSTCVNCNFCLNVCPYNNISDKNEESIFYGAYNVDNDIVSESSSGGIFWLLVQYAIAQKGVVYGCALEDNFFVVHRRAKTLKDCEKFRRSKYLQSTTADTYNEAKQDLKAGKIVLYSGTPCQIAGLYSFLKDDYDNLITCEVICHGVPSKMLFDKYIQEISVNKKAVSMIWRDKRNGWGPNHVSVQFDDKSEIVSVSINNPYQRGFLDNFYLRPSCNKCPFARLPRIADISLADFWNYEGNLKQSNNNKGLSVVITSSKKGNEVWESCKKNTIYEYVSEEYVKKCSRHVWTHPVENKRRKKFFLKIKRGKSFCNLMKYYIEPPLHIIFYNKAKGLMKWLMFPHI